MSPFNCTRQSALSDFCHTDRPPVETKASECQHPKIAPVAFPPIAQALNKSKPPTPQNIFRTTRFFENQNSIDGSLHTSPTPGGPRPPLALLHTDVRRLDDPHPVPVLHTGPPLLGLLLGRHTPSVALVARIPSAPMAPMRAAHRLRGDLRLGLEGRIEVEALDVAVAGCRRPTSWLRAEEGQPVDAVRGRRVAREGVGVVVLFALAEDARPVRVA